MTRQFTPLSGEDLVHLPAECRGCRYWELGVSGPSVDRHPVDPAARTHPGLHHAEDDKRAWLSARLETGQPPGRRLVVDGRHVGYALYGPVSWFARPRPATVRGLVPRPAPPDDATLLATLHVARAARGRGHGTALVHAALRDTVRARHPSLVAYGDHRHGERGCYLPATWLLHLGFTVLRQHPRTPLFHLDTSRVARWTDSLEQALEEMLGRLPRLLPGPAPRGEPVPAPGSRADPVSPNAASR